MPTTSALTYTLIFFLTYYHNLLVGSYVFNHHSSNLTSTDRYHFLSQPSLCLLGWVNYFHVLLSVSLVSHLPKNTGIVLCFTTTFCFHVECPSVYSNWTRAPKVKVRWNTSWAFTLSEASGRMQIWEHLFHLETSMESQPLTCKWNLMNK